MSSIHLVLGGIRSGKSAYAERLAAELAGPDPALYVATGIAVDAEMEERIQRHQQGRPPNWQTIEAPLNPVGALQGHSLITNSPVVLLLDSMDVWVSNLMLQHETTPRMELEARIVGAVRRFADYVRELESPCGGRQQRSRLLLDCHDFNGPPVPGPAGHGEPGDGRGRRPGHHGGRRLAGCNQAHAGRPLIGGWLYLSNAAAR